MQSKLAGFIVPNQHGHYIGTVAFVIRDQLIAGEPLLLPYARTPACMSIQHAQENLIILSDEISEQVQQMVDLFMKPIKEHVLHGDLLPIFRMFDVREAQRAPYWANCVS